MQRVIRSVPLSNADTEEVISLMHAGLLTVTPTYTAGEKCPYRLTEAGQEALREPERP